jgi:hypothetical protein
MKGLSLLPIGASVSWDEGGRGRASEILCNNV